MMRSVGIVFCFLLAGVGCTYGQNIRNDDTMIDVSAGWLCEGLECPSGTECTLEQGKCTPEDCSLKPSCSPRLPKCKGCKRGCAHAIIARGATIGCHPCLCEISVRRSLVEQIKEARALEAAPNVTKEDVPEEHRASEEDTKETSPETPLAEDELHPGIHQGTLKSVEESTDGETPVVVVYEAVVVEEPQPN
ncbi:uncharacterized protein LOC135395323 [Ornithodoros turicata]|uniref:uncharacterized protein LOC135395323 n=1 Tax=Ornithodoros turicata TaxID=34597 RepID=UPI00313A0E11